MQIGGIDVIGHVSQTFAQILDGIRVFYVQAIECQRYGNVIRTMHGKCPGQVNMMLNFLVCPRLQVKQYLVRDALHD